MKMQITCNTNCQITTSVLWHRPQLIIHSLAPLLFSAQEYEAGSKEALSGFYRGQEYTSFTASYSIFSLNSARGIGQCGRIYVFPHVGQQDIRLLGGRRCSNCRGRIDTAQKCRRLPVLVLVWVRKPLLLPTEQVRRAHESLVFPSTVCTTPFSQYSTMPT